MSDGDGDGEGDGDGDGVEMEMEMYLKFRIRCSQSVFLGVVSRPNLNRDNMSHLHWIWNILLHGASRVHWCNTVFLDGDGDGGDDGMGYH